MTRSGALLGHFGATQHLQRAARLVNAGQLRPSDVAEKFIDVHLHAARVVEQAFVHAIQRDRSVADRKLRRKTEPSRILSDQDRTYLRTEDTPLLLWC